MKALFSDDYFQARQRFLDASRKAGLTIETFSHPEYRDPRGEAAIDVVRIGAREAGHVLFVTSGLHGTEGTTGSAVQLGLIEQCNEAPLPTDTAVVLVHAVNPVGFIRLTRGNEDNIDLNRNFVDFSRPLPENPDYLELHPALCSSQWQGERRQQDDRYIERYVEKNSVAALTEKVLKGQYSHPDGIFFGGTEPAWSNTQVRQIFQQQVAGSKAVGLIDVHTGVGPQGVGLILRDEQSFSADGGLAVIGGQMRSALDDLDGPGRRIKIILEFGTLEFTKVLTALRDDNWLTRNPEADDSVRQQIKNQLNNALRIDEDDWYQAIWDQSRRLVADVICELRQQPASG